MQETTRRGLRRTQRRAPGLAAAGPRNADPFFDKPTSQPPPARPRGKPPRAPRRRWCGSCRRTFAARRRRPRCWAVARADRPRWRGVSRQERKHRRYPLGHLRGPPAPLGNAVGARPAEGKLRPQLTDRRVSSASCSSSAFSSVALRYGVSISSCVCAVRLDRACSSFRRALRCMDPAAGSQRKRSSVRSARWPPAPAAMSWRRAAARRRSPAHCAAATAAAPGSATAGRPASEIKPTSLPAKAGGEQFAPQRVARCRVACATALGGRGSSRMSMACSGR